MNKIRVLIADDEVEIIKLLEEVLQYEGWRVFVAMDGAEALRIIENELLDLIILDIMMPLVDGYEVLRRIRKWSQIPVIILSARGEIDKVRYLNLGADDYITKPFAVEELISRARAVLRRKNMASSIPSSFSSGDISVDFATRQVIVANKEVKLTPTEYSLLQELVFNAGKVLTYTYLLKKIWGPEYRQEKEYLHILINHLRSKLELNPEKPVYIISIPGVGYRFRASR